jgi:hypothetical protein
MIMLSLSRPIETRSMFAKLSHASQMLGGHHKSPTGRADLPIHLTLTHSQEHDDSPPLPYSVLAARFERIIPCGTNAMSKFNMPSILPDHAHRGNCSTLQHTCCSRLIWPLTTLVEAIGPEPYPDDLPSPSYKGSLLIFGYAT